MRREFEINDAVVNALVVRFQNGDASAFNDLFQTVASFVRKAARNEEAKSGIPASEFESRFFEWLWRCAETWDGRTTFMQRFVAVIDLRTIDVVRSYTAKKNKGVNHQTLSLDKPVNQDDSDGQTFKDLIADEGADILPALIERELRGDAARIMGQFHQENARYAAAVYRKLVCDLDGDELAQHLGFDTYDQNARKLVSRAVESFRRFATEQLAAA